MPLAIIVPVKDHRRHVEPLLHDLPSYLEHVNSIVDFTICIAE